MKNCKQIIIFGGGTSIEQGLYLGLLPKIKNKFVLGCNFMYSYHIPTALVFADLASFYRRYYGELKEAKLPMILGCQNANLSSKLLPDTFLLKDSGHYHRDLNKGVYTSFLTGLFALSLAIHILDEGEIFLLGMDFGGKPSDTDSIKLKYAESSGKRQWDEDLKIETEDIHDKTKLMTNKVKPFEANNNVKNNKRAVTHFYQGQLEHQGVGKIKSYYTHEPIDYYGVYTSETKCKIYNVSPYSRIPESIFPKITYQEMFSKLNEETIDQNSMRELIKEKIQHVIVRGGDKP